MKTSLLVLALSPAWALPSAAQEALLDPGPLAQYSALMEWTTPSTTVVQPYVVAIHGLVFSHKPDPTPKPAVSSKWPAFAFMGTWDPSNPLYVLFPTGPTCGSTRNTISLKMNGANPDCIYWQNSAIQLGGARIREWELFAENGIFVAESAKFTYTTKQTVTLAED